MADHRCELRGELTLAQSRIEHLAEEVAQQRRVLIITAVLLVGLLVRHWGQP